MSFCSVFIVIPLSFLDTLVSFVN